MDNSNSGERIAKVIARSGICSRREAETLISEGKVKIDGEIITTPAIRVTNDNKVTVNGKPIPKFEQARLWLFHKPKGCLTANKDPRGRPTIFHFLPKTLPRVITIGRLDYNSEGLLLLTNDGELARKMELPANGFLRKYRVRAYGSVHMGRIEEIRQGATVEGIKYEPAEVNIGRATGDNLWLDVTVKEGKNREVRRLMDYAGLEVNKLIRTEYGPFKLGGIPRCAVVEIEEKDFP